MKKLEKLLINPEKVITNENLLNFKGGNPGMPCCWCQNNTDIIGAILLPESCSTNGCTQECITVYGPLYPNDVITGLCYPGY